MTVVLTGVGAALALAGGALLVLRRQLLLVTVEGESMEPTYAAGDRLIVRRTTPATDPPLLVKRAVALPGDPVPGGIPVPDRMVPAGRLVVLGDNADRSADSRGRGFIPATDVVGVLLRQHAPPA